MSKKKIKSKEFIFDQHFYVLAQEIANAIKNNKDGSDQKKQINRLLAAEKAFIKSIWSYPKICSEIYKKFIIHIVVVNRSVLTAQPFFRENSNVFHTEISPALKEGKFKKLKNFAVNFKFIKFIKDNWPGKLPDKAMKYYLEAEKARRILIENNMPLAVNRAKMFYKKAPQSHLDLNDVIGIAAIGLISGIDKWSAHVDYSSVFVSLCIGNMTGYMIENQSETLMHFFPSDKTIMYRANTFKHRYGIDDPNILCTLVNESFADNKNYKPIQVWELEELFSAASPNSGDVPANDENAKTTFFDAYISDKNDLESSLEMKDFLSQLSKYAKQLDILDQKILKLKGVKL
jgi:hypothetical protein